MASYTIHGRYLAHFERYDIKAGTIHPSPDSILSRYLGADFFFATVLYHNILNSNPCIMIRIALDSCQYTALLKVLKKYIHITFGVLKYKVQILSINRLFTLQIDLRSIYVPGEGQLAEYLSM